MAGWVIEDFGNILVGPFSDNIAATWMVLQELGHVIEATIKLDNCFVLLVALFKFR